MLNMARGIIMITAVVAGVIGSGAGVYLVPNEKADQFRTMANEKANQFSTMMHSGLGAIYRAVYSDKDNAEPDVAAGSQRDADAQCDPGYSNCRGGLTVDAAAPQAIPDRDAAEPGSPPEKDDQP
jgi:LAS superfamily LD-carboxypeptidase LdcB